MTDNDVRSVFPPPPPAGFSPAMLAELAEGVETCEQSDDPVGCDWCGSFVSGEYGDFCSPACAEADRFDHMTLWED